MKSAIVKRSIVISGHKTSISLEDPFWSYLKEIAKSKNATLSSLVGQIETGRQYGNLSSAVRLFVLEHSRGRSVSAVPDAAAADGRQMNGIGQLPR